MPDIITQGSTTITPTIVLDVAMARSGGTLVHRILGRTNPDITLRAGGLRAGRLELGFAGANAEALSRTAEATHINAAIFTLTSTDRPTLNMSYVVPDGGRIERVLEPETRDAWTVLIDYQEVIT